MEATFFVRRAEEQRAVWFTEFVEMARRIWLLHCLFHALDGGAFVFQAYPGSRFSEVYMESVTCCFSLAGHLHWPPPRSGAATAIRQRRWLRYDPPQRHRAWIWT
jgi:hypothetical protein